MANNSCFVDETLLAYYNKSELFSCRYFDEIGSNIEYKYIVKMN